MKMTTMMNGPMRDFPIRDVFPDDLPRRVREMADPPKRLFSRGVFPREDLRHICIVGARKHSDYGKEACETLVRGLRGFPVAIVSGLAFGIDAIAHRAALAHDIYTVAIPGSGLSENVLYPRAHFNLAREILESGGALVSEFEPGFKATPWGFPLRNRIMAGLCELVIVIECAEKSGTLITARLALDYNRTVGAVPGSIFSPASAGPNKLLRQGAIPIRSADDILEVLDIRRAVQEDVEAAQQRLELESLGDDEKALLTALDEPRDRSLLAEKLGWSVSRTLIALSLLEIKGLIHESLGLVRRH